MTIAIALPIPHFFDELQRQKSLGNEYYGILTDYNFCLQRTRKGITWSNKLDIHRKEISEILREYLRSNTNYGITVMIAKNTQTEEYEKNNFEEQEQQQQQQEQSERDIYFLIAMKRKISNDIGYTTSFGFWNSKCNFYKLSQKLYQ